MPKNKSDNIEGNKCRKNIYNFLYNAGLTLSRDQQKEMKKLLKYYVQSETEYLYQRLKKANKQNHQKPSANCAVGRKQHLPQEDKEEKPYFNTAFLKR